VTPLREREHLSFADVYRRAVIEIDNEAALLVEIYRHTLHMHVFLVHSDTATEERASAPFFEQRIFTMGKEIEVSCF
jgi:hypothetical protein